MLVEVWLFIRVDNSMIIDVLVVSDVDVSVSQAIVVVKEELKSSNEKVVVLIRVSVVGSVVVVKRVSVKEEAKTDVTVVVI